MNAWLHQRRQSRRRGQSLVIIALSATALLGIIALGMDAGRLYFQRRDVQNAADAGALAGAEELIPTGAFAGQTNGMRTQANCQASLYALRNISLTPTDSTCSAGAYQPNGNGYIREPSSDGTATITVWTPSRGVSNEIHVQVSYRVPLTFAAIIGFTSSSVVADAYAHGGFVNKTYTVFGFDSGGSGNSVNYDQNGNAQIDDGFNGTDMCNPSGVDGKMVSNAKWHAPNPNGGWLDMNGQFFYAQASDTHALTLYWYSGVTTGIATEPAPNYEAAPNPGGIQPTPDVIAPGGNRSYSNGDSFHNTTAVDWTVYSPGQYTANINLSGSGYYLFRNGIYYLNGASLNVTGGVVVANTSDGRPHTGPYGGITDLNPASDGTNGVIFVMDGASTVNFTSSRTASPSVFLVAPSILSRGTDSIVFFVQPTDTVSGPNGTPWVEQIDGTLPTGGGYPFQIWGSIYNSDQNGSHGTGVVIQAASTGTYAVTGEIVSPQVDLDGGNLASGSYTNSTPGTPCSAGPPPGYFQNPAGRLVQFNTHYVPHFRGLALLVK
jgi:Flp pilus assembly protein TadG